MARKNKNRDNELGRLVTVHPIAPAYVQRAVFMAVLSFMFFLGMMFAFYVRQSLLFFLLSTAFLMIYLITMFSWVMQRKGSVEYFENGVKHRKNTVLWSEITSVSDAGEITHLHGKKFTIPATVSESEKLVQTIKARVSAVNG